MSVGRDTIGAVARVDPAPPVVATDPLSPPLLPAQADTISETNEQAEASAAAVAALCIPLSASDPCGPDLDLAGDAEYLNFFAQAEGLLPSSFFSSDDGRPFDRASVDLPGQMRAIPSLWNRSRDLRLLVMRARLLILDRDLGGFAASVAAIAHWLETYWDDVHPRATDDDFSARASALGALDLPTVVFPLQYAPLFEARRIGVITYRAWMIASGDVKARSSEQKHPPAALTEAIADAAPQALAATRQHVAMLRTALARIRNVCIMQGRSLELDNLPALVDKLHAFIDPRAAHEEETASHTAEGDDMPVGGSAAETGTAVSSAPTSLGQAQQALAEIVSYYIHFEPSSPALPLIRQAHQLIGKSFFEVMGILLPTQLEKASFQIGSDQVFELPIGKLAKLAEPTAPPPEAASLAGSAATAGNGATPHYRIGSRSQAITLLEQVQRFFRHAEPSSPVPMLCDRARALAERDFMSVLREVLPKAALKASGSDK